MADYAIHDTTLLGIAGIIRKKDGTVAGIDPADFRDRINLMGMLEEATKSGAIATITDGADDVPCKNVIAEIPANLSGVSAVTVTRTGSNLFDISTAINGNLNINTGNVDTSSPSWRTSDFIKVKPGNYTLSWESPQSSYYQAKWVAYNAEKTRIDGATQTGYTTTGTFTFPEGTVYVRIGWAITASGNPAPKENIRLNAGNTDKGFEPYVAPEEYEALLGRTIYGGTVDLVTGEGTKSAGKAVFTGSETWQLYSNETFWYTTLQADNIKVQQSCTTSNGVVVRYQSTSGQLRVYISQNVGVVDTETDMNALLSNGVSFVYPYETPETFTFEGQEIPTILGAQNFWSDAGGDTTVVYRSAGTITPVQPDLITKTITENGTYTASDDGADGYSEVTVNVSGGGGNTPEASATLICDNSAYASALTFTDDYTNYDVLKIVTYRADAGTELVFYMTPAMLDAMWQYSNNLVNFNQPYTNQFVTYQKTTNTAWTRYGKRNMDIKYVYGLVFTNCTCTETELYNRRGNGSSDVTFTPPTGKTFHDYDYILFSTSTGSNDETEPSLEVFQPNQEKDIFGSDNTREESVIVNKYNSGGKTITVGENTITSHAYFFVAGIELSF